MVSGLLFPARERGGWFVVRRREGAFVEGSVGIEIPSAQVIAIRLFHEDGDVPELTILAELNGEGFGRGHAGIALVFVAQDGPDVALVGIGRVEIDFVDARHSFAEAEVVSVVELDLVALLGPVL